MSFTVKDCFGISTSRCSALRILFARVFTLRLNISFAIYLACAEPRGGPTTDRSGALAVHITLSARYHLRSAGSEHNILEYQLVSTNGPWCQTSNVSMDHVAVRIRLRSFDRFASAEILISYIDTRRRSRSQPVGTTTQHRVVI